jgi:hypothetical protein
LLKDIGEEMKDDSLGDPDIDSVRDKLGVSAIKNGKVDQDGMINAVDKNGDPAVVFKQQVNF